MSEHAGSGNAHALPAHCENCDAALHGEFCHACGQSVHNPIRHLGHAVEEFFEAFWHLDGRLWRTLRDLWSPGRVAINYLAGHRARYIAPLRLFVVLSVLTFFIGAVVIHADEPRVDGTGIEAIDAATTVEEVRRIRDEAVGQIEAARRDAGNKPGVDPALVVAEVRIQSAAANRILELEGKPASDGAAIEDAPEARAPRKLQLNILGHRGEWDAVENPFIVSWWPRFANNWLNRKLGNVEKNMHALGQESADGWLQSMMASAPSALFLLVPVFALLLRIAYVFTRRVYLEHLVVALYSHVFLLIMLTLAFLLSAVNSWVTSTFFSIVLSTAFAVVLAWMPIYLLLMQKRVYGQAWWLTILKYFVIGNIYFVLLMFATILVFLARLTA